MNERYVYFRAVSDVADDDDIASSCLYPLSSFMGGYTSDATAIILFFKTMHEYEPLANTNRDSVILETINGASGSVFNDIMEEFSTGESYLIVIGDDAAGKYHVSGVIGVTGINTTASVD